MIIQCSNHNNKICCVTVMVMPWCFSNVKLMYSQKYTSANEQHYTHKRPNVSITQRQSRLQCWRHRSGEQVVRTKANLVLSITIAKQQRHSSTQSKTYNEYNFINHYIDSMGFAGQSNLCVSMVLTRCDGEHGWWWRGCHNSCRAA